MNKDNDIKRILIDIGCDSCFIDKYMQCGNDKERLKCLTAYRKKLVEQYHNDIKKIDILDYLVVKINEGK